MHIALRTLSSSEDDGGGCDLAFVDIDATLAQEYLRRMDVARQLKAQEKDFRDIRYWSWEAELVEVDGEDEALEALFTRTADAEVVYVGAALAVDPDAIQGIDSSWMRVTDESVRWQAVPKGSSLVITTAAIPRADLEALGAGREAELLSRSGAGAR